MGEFELLAELRSRIGPLGPRVIAGPGDDAAITVPAGATATSVDAIVDGVHFRRDLAPLPSIGRKALAAALSDLAAMGAAPGEAYTVLGVPADLDEAGCLELFSGLEALATETGVALAGGDVCRSPVLFASITVVGHASDPDRFVRRSGARPGDLLAATGGLGGAAGGLRLLERPELAAALDEAVGEALRARQLEPSPRLAAGAALAEAGATAMIDLSDGLGGDAEHLAAESGMLLTIDAGSLPVAPGVREIAAALGDNPLALAVSGGEDYELLATIPPGRAEAAIAAVRTAGAELTVIGRVEAGSGVEIRLPGGGSFPARGHDQLRPAG